MEKGVIPLCTNSFWFSAIQHGHWILLWFCFLFFGSWVPCIGKGGLLLGSYGQEQKIEKDTDTNQSEWSGKDEKPYAVITASILFHF